MNTNYNLSLNATGCMLLQIFVVGVFEVSNDVIVKCLIKYFKKWLMLFVVFIVNNRGGNNS